MADTTTTTPMYTPSVTFKLPGSSPTHMQSMHEDTTMEQHQWEDTMTSDVHQQDQGHPDNRTFDRLDSDTTPRVHKPTKVSPYVRTDYSGIPSSLNDAAMQSAVQQTPMAEERNTEHHGERAFLTRNFGTYP